MLGELLHVHLGIVDSVVAALPRLLLVLEDALLHHVVEEEDQRRPRLAVRVVLHELIGLAGGYPGPTRIVEFPDLLHERRLVWLEEGEKPPLGHVELHIQPDMLTYT